MPPGDYYGSWRAMDEFSANGKIRAAGVCNFLPELLAGLCRNTDTIPAVSRVEMRPFFRQDGAGMAMYGEQIALREKIVLSIFLFLSWGVNQTINDYLNIREDRIPRQADGKRRAQSTTRASYERRVERGLMTYNDIRILVKIVIWKFPAVKPISRFRL